MVNGVVSTQIKGGSYIRVEDDGMPEGNAPSVAVNTFGSKDYHTAQPFIDMLKSARSFDRSYKLDDRQKERIDDFLDEDGYPTHIPQSLMLTEDEAESIVDGLTFEQLDGLQITIGRAGGVSGNDIIEVATGGDVKKVQKDGTVVHEDNIWSGGKFTSVAKMEESDGEFTLTFSTNGMDSRMTDNLDRDGFAEIVKDVLSQIRYTNETENVKADGANVVMDVQIKADGISTSKQVDITSSEHIEAVSYDEFSSIFKTNVEASGFEAGDVLISKYKGEGEVEYGSAFKVLKEGESIEYNGKTYTPEEGRDILIVKGGNASFEFTISKTDPNGTGDYIRDMHIMRAEHEELFDAGAIINPDFHEKAEDFSMLRSMEIMETNGNDQLSVEDRPHSGGFGNVSYEDMVRIANETGTDMWINIPHLPVYKDTDETVRANNGEELPIADYEKHTELFREYVQDVANSIKDTLNPNLKVNFEFTNELWNWDFTQTHYASQSGHSMFYDIKEKYMKASDPSSPSYDPEYKAMIEKSFIKDKQFAKLEQQQAEEGGDPFRDFVENMEPPGDLHLDWYAMKVMEMGQIVNEVFADQPDMASIVYASHYEGLEKQPLDKNILFEATHDGQPIEEVAKETIDKFAISAYVDGGVGHNSETLMENLAPDAGGYEYDYSDVSQQQYETAAQDSFTRLKDGGMPEALEAMKDALPQMQKEFLAESFEKIVGREITDADLANIESQITNVEKYGDYALSRGMQKAFVDAKGGGLTDAERKIVSANEDLQKMVDNIEDLSQGKGHEGVWTDDHTSIKNIFIDSASRSKEPVQRINEVLEENDWDNSTLYDDFQEKMNNLDDAISVNSAFRMQYKFDYFKQVADHFDAEMTVYEGGQHILTDHINPNDYKPEANADGSLKHNAKEQEAFEALKEVDFSETIEAMKKKAAALESGQRIPREDTLTLKDLEDSPSFKVVDDLYKSLSKEGKELLGDGNYSNATAADIAREISFIEALQGNGSASRDVADMVHAHAEANHYEPWVEQAIRPFMHEYFKDLNADARMGDMYEDLMNYWKDAGGAEMNLFSLAGMHSKYGYFGMLENIADDGSARYDTAVEFSRENDRWWDDREAETFADGKTLIGTDGDDIIEGGIGNDGLKGGAGDDTLSGGDRNLTDEGDTNRDYFAFDEEFGNDVITDFAKGEVIWLKDVAPRAVDVRNIVVSKQDNGNGTINVTISENGTIIRSFNMDSSHLGKGDGGALVTVYNVAGVPVGSIAVLGHDAQTVSEHIQYGGNAVDFDRTEGHVNYDVIAPQDGGEEEVDNLRDGNRNLEVTEPEVVETPQETAQESAPQDTAPTPEAQPIPAVPQKLPDVEMPVTPAVEASSEPPAISAPAPAPVIAPEPIPVQEQPEEPAIASPSTQKGSSINYGDPHNNPDAAFDYDSVVDYRTKGDDMMLGDDAANTFISMGGNDYVMGLGGDDSIRGMEGDDILAGGTGNDTVGGGVGDDQVYGGIGDDRVVGGDGDDIVYGGDGDDYVSGGLGDDILFGGAGDDMLRGGSGSDIFNLFDGSGSDVISDFDIQEDRLSIDVQGTGIHNVNELRGYVTEGRNGAKIDFGDSDNVELIGISVEDLIAGNVGIDFS